MSWQPIETAPKDGSVVLGWRFYLVAIKWTGDDVFPWEAIHLGGHPCLGLKTNGFCDGDMSLTHWMPKPTPPTGASHD